MKLVHMVFPQQAIALGNSLDTMRLLPNMEFRNRENWGSEHSRLVRYSDGLMQLLSHEFTVYHSTRRKRSKSCRMHSFYELMAQVTHHKSSNMFYFEGVS